MCLMMFFQQLVVSSLASNYAAWIVGTGSSRNGRKSLRSVGLTIALRGILLILLDVVDFLEKDGLQSASTQA